MKFLASGDHHWDLHKRWAECARIHGWMVERVHDEKPDLFISTGDIYERASLPLERLAVANWLRQIAEVCPVLVVKGNHDSARDCALLAELRTDHPITVEEGAAVHYIAGAAIAAVAWPDRAQLLAYAREQGDLDPDAVAQDALRHVLRGLGAALADFKGPRIGAGHFMTDGAVTSLGQPLIGQPMNVSLEDLALLNADIVVMGHVHKPQEWLHGTTPMLYTGSSFRTAYGELEEKSIVSAGYDGLRNGFDWRRIPTPAAPMFLVTEEWDTEDACFGGGPEAHIDPADVTGAEIRFRYGVWPDQRAAARIDAAKWSDEWLALGAVSVKIEEMVHTSTRARAPEIAAAVTLGDKLHALWKARDTIPETSRAERLIGMAGELEQEAAS